MQWNRIRSLALGAALLATVAACDAGEEEGAEIEVAPASEVSEPAPMAGDTPVAPAYEGATVMDTASTE